MDDSVSQNDEMGPQPLGREAGDSGRKIRWIVASIHDEATGDWDDVPTEKFDTKEEAKKAAEDAIDLMAPHWRVMGHVTGEGVTSAEYAVCREDGLEEELCEYTVDEPDIDEDAEEDEDFDEEDIDEDEQEF